MADEPRSNRAGELAVVAKLFYALIIVVALTLLVALAMSCDGQADELSRMQPEECLKLGGKLLSRLAIAALLGVVIGIDRERREKPAGVRTVAMVTVGACLFALVGVSIHGSNDALSRVVQGIITGIGFLGAGTIMKHEFHIEGLTTAATLWAVAGVGLACGVGYYVLAIVGTGIIWAVLKVMRVVEARFRPRNGGAGQAGKS